jgi:branched-chain amino acid transport system permease protein
MPLRTLTYLAALAGLIILPVYLNSYNTFVLNTILIFALVGLGFNIVIGFLGQLAFINIALFGTGAYAAALAGLHVTTSLPGLLIAGGLAGGFIGAASSVAALRGVRGFYLGILTLAVGELLRWTYNHAEAVTNGSSGLTMPPVTAFGLPLSSDLAKYYVFLGCAVSLYWITANLLKSRFGRAIVAIRDNELAAAYLAIPTGRYIVSAFGWSGFIVGCAGALLAVLLSRVAPDSFDLSHLLTHFAIVVIGGVSTLLGPLFGAIVVMGAPEMLRSFQGLEEILFAVILVVVLLVQPSGIMGLITRLCPQLTERMYRTWSR